MESNNVTLNSFQGLSNFQIAEVYFKQGKSAGQIYYGSEDFIEGIKIKHEGDFKEIPRMHRNPLRPELGEILKKKEDISMAYKEYGYKMKEIANHFGVHYATISRRIKRLECENV